MTLRLCLLRHAKSDWDDPELDDLDRPLSPRGIKAAPRMGRYLAEQAIVPDRVLCSTALRARQTWDLVSEHLPEAPCWPLKELYNFGLGDAVIEAIRVHGGDARTLLLIGHNPSLQSAANALVNDGPPKALKRLAHKFPTAALAVLEFDLPDWSRLSRASATLTRFKRPRSLAD